MYVVLGYEPMTVDWVCSSSLAEIYIRVDGSTHIMGLVCVCVCVCVCVEMIAVLILISLPHVCMVQCICYGNDLRSCHMYISGSILM